MNRLEVRTALVKRTGRYDLVGSQDVDGLHVPNYAIDNGIDAIIDAATRRLDEQIKLRINRMKRVYAVNSGNEFVRIPTLRTALKVQYQETATACPYTLDLIEAEDLEHWKYKALQHADVCTRPHLFCITPRGILAQATGTTVTVPYVVPNPAPSAAVADFCDPTGTYGIRRISTREIVYAAESGTSSFNPNTTTNKAMVINSLSPEAQYEGYVRITESFAGGSTRIHYTYFTVLIPPAYGGITLVPSPTVDGGILTVDGWFYTSWDSAATTSTCWWSIFDSNLLLHMATVEMGIAVSDENVTLAAKRIEQIQRSQISDDISTEVAMLGNRSYY